MADDGDMSRLEIPTPPENHMPRSSPGLQWRCLEFSWLKAKIPFDKPVQFCFVYRQFDWKSTEKLCYRRCRVDAAIWKRCVVIWVPKIPGIFFFSYPNTYHADILTPNPNFLWPSYPKLQISPKLTFVIGKYQFHAPIETLFMLVTMLLFYQIIIHSIYNIL